MMLESLHVEKNMGGLSTHVVNVLSICLQEHWTYVESLGLAKLPGEEPCGVTWSLVKLESSFRFVANDQFHQLL